MPLPKIKITRAGGYDPALGPDHPANQDPTLEAHRTEIDLWATERVRGGPEDKKHRVRWHCICGRLGPPIRIGEVKNGKSAERRARDGGIRHVAAMERG
jgi:hypothetical protein